MIEDREKTCPDCGGNGCAWCEHSGAVPLRHAEFAGRKVAADLAKHATPEMRAKLAKLKRQVKR